MPNVPEMTHGLVAGDHGHEHDRQEDRDAEAGLDIAQKEVVDRICASLREGTQCALPPPPRTAAGS